MGYTVWMLAWRYFTGLHMDGKLRKTAKHGTVLPRYSSYFWNRYSRKRRALWRHVAFWGGLATAYGLVFDRNVTVYAALCFAPFVAFALIRRLVDMLTQVVAFQDGDGVRSNYRVIRPQIRRWITKHRPAKVRVSLPDGGPVPPEIARAIMAENAEDGGEPILAMRVPTELQMEAGNEPKRIGRNAYRRKT
jgi:hypothetical protein